MSRAVAFVELEQKIEQLVQRYSQTKDENDALKREVGFLRQENQRLQTEQKDVEDKVSRILRRVQMQEQEYATPLERKAPESPAPDADYDEGYSADASRYESSTS